MSDEIFLTWLAFKVPSTLSGVINPVTWSGVFSTNGPSVSVNWKWSAAVYTSFSTNNNALGVKPTHSHACLFNNSDHAGTPENFTAFVVGGARGGGGSEVPLKFELIAVDAELGQTVEACATLSPGREI